MARCDSLQSYPTDPRLSTFCYHNKSDSDCTLFLKFKTIKPLEPQIVSFWHIDEQAKPTFGIVMNEILKQNTHTPRPNMGVKK